MAICSPGSTCVEPLPANLPVIISTLSHSFVTAEGVVVEYIDLRHLLRNRSCSWSERSRRGNPTPVRHPCTSAARAWNIPSLPLSRDSDSVRLSQASYPHSCYQSGEPYLLVSVLSMKPHVQSGGRMQAFDFVLVLPNLLSAMFSTSKGSSLSQKHSRQRIILVEL